MAQFIRQTCSQSTRCLTQRALFSTTSRALATDPTRELEDMINPRALPRNDVGAPTPSRHPNTPSDSRNPSLQGYPDRRGRITTSTMTDDTTTPQSPPPRQQKFRMNATRSFAAEMQPRKNGSRPPMLSGRSFTNTRAPTKAQREADQQWDSEVESMTRHMHRVWRDGDVYSPHDLSPAEQMKTRTAKTGGRTQARQINTRSKGGKDILDYLSLNPLKHYKNFALLGEFMSPLGRIKHSRETGLRAVNQRKMAKAIRRAVGIGIMPSVHAHPEMMPERIAQRRNIRPEFKM